MVKQVRKEYPGVACKKYLDDLEQPPVDRYLQNLWIWSVIDHVDMAWDTHQAFVLTLHKWL